MVTNLVQSLDYLISQLNYCNNLLTELLISIPCPLLKQSIFLPNTGLLQMLFPPSELFLTYSKLHNVSSSFRSSRKYHFVIEAFPTTTNYDSPVILTHVIFFSLFIAMTIIYSVTCLFLMSITPNSRFFKDRDYTILFSIVCPLFSSLPGIQQMLSKYFKLKNIMPCGWCYDSYIF